MKELVDLYAKLLIGTFTFVGPSFTFLISLSYKELDRAKARNKAMLKQMLDSLSEDEDLFTLKQDIVKHKRLLNPRRQARRLFITLLIAIFLIAFYHFQHSHYWTYNIQWMRVVTLVISVLLYPYCLLVLWQVFCMIIFAKTEEEKENKDKRTVLQPAQQTTS